MLPRAQSDDVSVRLQLRHRAVSDAFTTLAPAGEGAAAEAQAEAAAAEHGPPLIVTFEDMARGLHFDAVDIVFILVRSGEAVR